MLKKLLAAIRTVEEFDADRREIASDLNRISATLRALQGQQEALGSKQDALESVVRTEVLNMAELYGKTYRLLKRMQAEDRHDTDHEEAPDIEPVADPVTARVLARRRQRVPESSESREG